MLFSEIIELIKNGESNYIDSNLIEDIDINGAASLEKAEINQITFLEENNIIKQHLHSTRASVIIISNNKTLINKLKEESQGIIAVSNPRVAFAEVLEVLYKNQNKERSIDKSATIHKGAHIEENCYIGSNVFIGEGAKIGHNNLIYPGVVIHEDVQIGSNNIIHSNCVIFPNTIIRDNCVINSNTVLGSEGFGFIPKNGKWEKMPQKGGVIINNNVEIGTNCCVDRPSVGDTIIGDGTKIDNLVQIGHGVIIGKNCAFAAQVGIAGGATIGDGVILAGQVGVNNRVKVGNNVIASSKCGIHSDVQDGEIISGFPAIPNKLWLKSSSIFKKLPEIAKKLRQLDNK